MKRFAGSIIFWACFLVFAGLILWMLRTDAQPAKADVSISVVVYGDNADRWRSLELGIRQACAELGIEKPAITLSGGSTEQQLGYLQREVDNGAEGLLVAAESPELGAYLSGLSIPVVGVVAGAGEELPLVAADDVAMARALANLHAGQGKTIAVLAENLHRENILVRYNAFFERAAELDQWVMVLENDREGMTLEQYVRYAVRVRSPDVLVVLDNDTLEVVSAALSGGPQVQLCGIGSSEAVVHALDNARIDELCFSNEYAIGYLGTMQLAAQMGLAKPPEEVPMQYGIARRETMYRPENERILFPIMQ